MPINFVPDIKNLSQSAQFHQNRITFFPAITNL